MKQVIDHKEDDRVMLEMLCVWGSERGCVMIINWNLARVDGTNEMSRVVAYEEVYGDVEEIAAYEGVGPRILESLKTLLWKFEIEKENVDSWNKCLKIHKSYMSTWRDSDTLHD